MPTNTASTSITDNHSTTADGTILVIGSSGKTGRRVLERLQQRNLDVRPVSRSTPIRFDWEDPASWRPALAGVRSAYISYYPDVATPEAPQRIRELTDLARRSGLSRLVLLSGRGEQEAQQSERIVQASGLQTTVIRANWFAQNFSEGAFAEEIRSGSLALPVDGVGEPFVDTEDVAEVAVAALTQDGHAGRVYELSGPRALTFAEAVAEVAAASGREIDFVPVSLDDYVAGAREQGYDEELISLLRYLFGTVLDGRNSTPTGDVERVLRRPPRDFRDHAAQAARTGAWAPHQERS